MGFTKITDAELNAVGVTTLEDAPAMSAENLKKKFEETAKELIAPKHNRLVDELQSENASRSIGATPPALVSSGTAKTLDAVLNAIVKYSKEHREERENPHAVSAAQVGAYTKAQTDDRIDEKVGEHTVLRNNPHAVTAAQVGSYTKKETDEAIDLKVQEIGSSDMTMGIYDPNHRKTDIFEVIGYFAQMAVQNRWGAPMEDDDGAWILDDDGFILLADWKYKEA